MIQDIFHNQKIMQNKMLQCELSFKELLKIVNSISQPIIDAKQLQNAFSFFFFFFILRNKLSKIK